ncbi:hypothetical protein QTA58_09575 [Neorhizobium sp. CSC1952]|uniref:hypothetical protein n=1 Tax=Neorhizobium sp. CSC1952 TaxID=2978974 RepID=UPI0025A64945|nr:hypothetical protein [Rhizobium sp. CSC1952]WJR68970.1 hypothetical protein QTA58_09575 [Rhizobium sp. CSC1952]
MDEHNLLEVTIAAMDGCWEKFSEARTLATWRAYAAAFRRAWIVARNLCPDCEIPKPTIRVGKEGLYIEPVKAAKAAISIDEWLANLRRRNEATLAELAIYSEGE